MNQYKIYENQGGLKEAVKQGWSWPASLFSGIWALFKKMNALGGGVLGGFFVLGLIAGAAGQGDSDGFNAILLLGDIAAFVTFGVNGNAWREKNLLSRGYAFKGATAAESDEAALAVYGKQGMQTADVSMIPPPPPNQTSAPRDPIYRIASNGVDLGDMSASSIKRGILDGKLSKQDYYFDVGAKAWRHLDGLADIS